MGNIGPWQLLIVAALIVLLFGARRLPELARGLGSSLRIFRAETKGMLEEDKSGDASAKSDPSESAEPSEPRASEPRAAESPEQAEPAKPLNESSNRDA